jgi:hypothetical protein
MCGDVVADGAKGCLHSLQGGKKTFTSDTAQSQLKSRFAAALAEMEAEENK